LCVIWQVTYLPNLIYFILFSASPRDDNEFAIKLQCKLWPWLMGILNFWFAKLDAFYSQALVSFKKIYAPSSSLLQGKHLPFSPSPLRLNIFRLFVILSQIMLRFLGPRYIGDDFWVESSLIQSSSRSLRDLKS
jgi:hypothetical protein